VSPGPRVTPQLQLTIIEVDDAHGTPSFGPRYLSTRLTWRVLGHFADLYINQTRGDLRTVTEA